MPPFKKKMELKNKKLEKEKEEKIKKKELEKDVKHNKKIINVNYHIYIHKVIPKVISLLEKKIKTGNIKDIQSKVMFDKPYHKLNPYERKELHKKFEQFNYLIYPALKVYLKDYNTVLSELHAEDITKIVENVYYYIEYNTNKKIPQTPYTEQHIREIINDINNELEKQADYIKYTTKKELIQQKINLSKW